MEAMDRHPKAFAGCKDKRALAEKMYYWYIDNKRLMSEEELQDLMKE